MNRTYCPGWVPPMARCPCPGFPTMQRAPAVSQGGGGASWRWCIRRVDLRDEGTCDTHKSTGAHKGADSELSCGLKARIPLGFFSRRHHLFSAFVNALRVLWLTWDYLWLAVSFWSQHLGLFFRTAATEHFRFNLFLLQLLHVRDNHNTRAESQRRLIVNWGKSPEMMRRCNCIWSLFFFLPTHLPDG